MIWVWSFFGANAIEMEMFLSVGNFLTQLNWCWSQRCISSVSLLGCGCLPISGGINTWFRSVSLEIASGLVTCFIPAFLSIFINTYCFVLADQYSRNGWLSVCISCVLLLLFSSSSFLSLGINRNSLSYSLPAWILFVRIYPRVSECILFKILYALIMCQLLQGNQFLLIDSQSVLWVLRCVLCAHGHINAPMCSRTSDKVENKRNK